MASKKTQKRANRQAGSAQKSNRHMRTVKKKGAGFPYLPVIVGGILALGAVGLIVIAWQQSRPPTGVSASVTGTPIKGITCGGEITVVHYHMHLDMRLNGNTMSVPNGIGFGANNTCLYWLHTHDATGLIHIEAPSSAKNRVFTLGDLFAVWGQPLDTRDLGSYKLASDETLTAYVDGVKWTKDLKAIPLKNHGEVALEITSGSGVAPVPPSSYNFPSGT